MIKSFKDFDLELNGQKVYEAFDDISNRKFKIEFPFLEKNLTKNDLFVPETLSDKKHRMLSKASRIILKKLKDSNIGNFGIQPTIINIDKNPGVLLYDYNDTSMNIIICRNVHEKVVYLFRDFDRLNFLDYKENVADLVLSTKTLGFSDLIDKLILYINENKKINESIILEMAKPSGEVTKLINWKMPIPKTSTGYTNLDTNRFKNIDVDNKLNIYNLIKDDSTANTLSKIIKTYNFSIYSNIVETFRKDGIGDLSSDDGVLVLKAAAIAIDYRNKVWENNDRMKTLKGDETVFKSDLLSAFTDLIEKLKGDLGDPTGETTGDPTGDEGGEDIEVHEDIKTLIDAHTSASKSSSDELESDYAEQRALYELQKRTMAGVTREYINFVKKRGKIENPKKELRLCLGSRGTIISGPGGIGKSKTIYETLDHLNMKRNVDYFSVGNGSTVPVALYNILYKWNGKLIIFDDSAHVFDGDYRSALWKNIFEGNDLRGTTIYHPDVRDADDVTGKLSERGLYNPISMEGEGEISRQKRYELEAGGSSRAVKDKFFKDEQERLKSEKLISRGDGSSLTTKDLEDIKEKVKNLWAKHEEAKKPQKPISFDFNGVVIFVTNDTPDILEAKLGTNYTPIVGRCKTIIIDPPGKIIWEDIKETITKEDTPDNERYVPKKMIDSFIEEVEKNFNLGGIINWRAIIRMSFAWGDDPSEWEGDFPDWKFLLKECMEIKPKKIK